MAGEMQATSNAEYPNVLAIDKNPEVVIVGSPASRPHDQAHGQGGDQQARGLHREEDRLGARLRHDYCFDKYFEKNGVDRSK